MLSELGGFCLEEKAGSYSSANGLIDVELSNKKTSSECSSRNGFLLAEDEDGREKKNSAIKLNPVVSRSRIDDVDSVIEHSSSSSIDDSTTSSSIVVEEALVVGLVVEPDSYRVIDEGENGPRKASQAAGRLRREAEKDGQEARFIEAVAAENLGKELVETNLLVPTIQYPLRTTSRRRPDVADRFFIIATQVDRREEQQQIVTPFLSPRLSSNNNNFYDDFPYFNRHKNFFRHSFVDSNRNSTTNSNSKKKLNRMASAVAAAAGVAALPDKDKESKEEIPSSFLRTDSIIIRIKAGQCFSDYSNVVVEAPARCDPRLGTLGELRHHLRTGTKQQVKRFLRHNNWTSGHRIRSELWKELCHDNNSDAQRAVYRDIVEKLGTVHTRPAFLAAPGVVLCDHQLKENGRICLLRLLTAIEHQRPDFTYVPVLYPLGALFLHYMNEEEAFACIMNLISQSQKFLIQTDLATAASKRTMLVLVKKHVNRAYALCKRLSGASDDKDLVAIFDEWKCWIFRDLPFSHLVRVVDCFLFEGQKVLYRVALAIIQLWSRDRSKEIRPNKIWSAREIGDDIAEYCKTIKVQLPKFLKTAFGIRNLKMSTVHRLQQKHELNLRHSNSGLAEVASGKIPKQVLASHHYIDVRLDSNILDHNQAMQMISWIPSRYQLQKPLRLFSTDEDGTSFTRLWTKLESTYPTIIVIRTSLNEVFGAYCSTAWDSWKRQSGIAYFGTGETFLFRFPVGAAEGEKFAWVGTKKSPVAHSEELFQSADSTTLVVGGGNDEGLGIRQSLESGSTGRCETFDNPMLSVKRDFQIQALEAFGFVTDQ